MTDLSIKQVHEHGEDGLTHHLTKTGTIEQGATNMLRGNTSDETYGNKSEVSPV